MFEEDRSQSEVRHIHCKARIDIKEGDAVYLMRENRLLWAAVAKQSNWFWSLSTTNAIEAINSGKAARMIIKKGVVFYHNNATFLTIRQKLKELGWEVLIHPPYSPNLTPSNYHLFWSL